MKKTYYKIDFRIGREVSVSTTMEILNYYYSDGYIVVTENFFEGFLTDDYIQGNIEQKEINIKVYEQSEEKAFKNTFKQNIKISKDHSYFLKSQDSNEISSIYFFNKIDDLSKQKEIEDTIKKVKISRPIQ